MCGRYSNTIAGPEFDLRMGDLLRVSRRQSQRGFERFNVAPTDPVLAAVTEGDGRRLAELRWGLVPSWTNGAKPGYTMINARAETVLERPTYRGLVERSEGRCLVLADGWYEWQKPEDPKQPRRPVRFSLRDGAPFCFAGLWSNETASCTIVTCEANELSRPIHDRMPVVLAEPERWDAWLDASLDGPAACELLAPLPSAQLQVRPANPLVNSVANDGPGCLEPELTLL
jgi:putative SOS response-associated peptidase YedK